jgi:hypothetical protein
LGHNVYITFGQILNAKYAERAGISHAAQVPYYETMSMSLPLF